jgi:hypothetical protein
MPPSDQTSLDPSHFSPDTLDFLRLLREFAVRYIVVGGEAVIFHGHARFTGDVDFFYAHDQQNVESLFRALGAFWGGTVPGIAVAEELMEPGLVVQFGRPPNRIDLLNRIDGVGFEEAWDTRLELSIPAGSKTIPLFMLSLEKLLQNKRASGRPKDLDDVKYLQAAAGESSI